MDWAARSTPAAPRRRRGLTEQDRAEWAAYARLVAPLPGQAPVDLAVPEASPALLQPQPFTPPAALLQTPHAPRPMPPLVVGMQPPGVDNATWDRLRTGKLAPSRTLDLHGRTAQRAFHALETFLRAAHAERMRCVEIITGRGSGSTGGVLWREFPLWLNLPDLRPLVLAASHPHAANTGAVRVLLRRLR